MSSKHQCVPLLWELANTNPIPEETPLSESTQLTPASLITNIIIRSFEKIVLKKWLNWLDNNVDHVRVISFDLKKAFETKNWKKLTLIYI